MGIHSFFLPRKPWTTESKHRDKGLNKTARTAAEKFLQVFTPFFQKSIPNLWQNALPVVAGSRGRNTPLYGRGRAWVARVRFYRDAIIRCPLIMSQRNLVGGCLPKSLVKKYGNDFNGSPSLKWAGFFSVLGRKERQKGGSKKILII